MIKYGLCIGINDYPGTDNDLQGCVNDAKDWYQVLENWRFDSLELMLDSNATKANIVQRIKDSVALLRAHDQLFITYSGHGTYVPDTNGDEPDRRDEALCPWDIMSGQYLIDDELADLFGPAKWGSRIVLISDSCFSGTVARMSRFGADPGAKEQKKVRFLPPSTFGVGDPNSMARASASPPGRHSSLLLSGCQDWEYSYDAWFGNRPNGAFTRAAIDVLSGADMNTLTFKSWFKDIRALLPSTNYPQSPNLYGLSYQKNWQVL